MKHSITMMKNEDGWIQVIVDDAVDIFEFNPHRYDSTQWAANYLQTQYKITRKMFDAALKNPQ